MNEIKNILLLGATGFTGKLISELLINEGIEFIAAGRDIKKLKEIYKDKITVKGINIDSVSSIKKVTEHTKIIINCIGPFNLLGERILEKIYDQKIIYIDVSGEQQHIYDSINLYNNKKDVKATFIHSVSFESFIAEILAELIIDQNNEYKDISSFYYSRGKISSGTRLSMRIKPFFDSYIYKEKQLIKAKPFDFNLKISFKSLPEYNIASFVPYPEVFIFSNRYKTKNAGSYIITTEFDVKVFKNKDFNVSKTIDAIVNEEQKRIRKFFTKEERIKQTFYVIVNTIDLKNSKKNICIKGNDTYGLTANLVVMYLKEILSETNISSGVFSPGSLIDCHQFFLKIKQLLNIKILKEDFEVTSYKNL